jgi:hypothetical protein
MVLKSDGGAIAYLSSSTLNDVSPLKLFGQNFYQIVTHDQPASLGLAMAKDKEQLVGVERTELLLASMHLFGDPDLKLPGISPTVTTNSSTVDLSTTGEGPQTVNFGDTPTSTENLKATGGCRTTNDPSLLLFLIFGLFVMYRHRLSRAPSALSIQRTPSSQ